MAIDGVCVVWKTVPLAPVYFNVPPAKTRLAAALVEAPMALG